MRNVGHGFGTAGYNTGGSASHDGLGGEDDGFGAGGADFVHSGADSGVGEAGVDGTLAGGILAETVGMMNLKGRRAWMFGCSLSGEDVAVEDFLDIFSLQG